MKSGAEVIERVISLSPLAQPQRTAPFSDFQGGRPCLDLTIIFFQKKKELISRNFEIFTKMLGHPLLSKIKLLKVVF